MGYGLFFDAIATLTRFLDTMQAVCAVGYAECGALGRTLAIRRHM